MTSNQPASDPPSDEAIMKKLKSYRWKGRALTGMALSIGLLSIAVGIVIAWAMAIRVMPMERLLLQDYPRIAHQTDTNSVASATTEAGSPLSRSELDWRHAQVTVAHAKALFLTAVSIALLGMGTFSTLLLVIFNRRATLRQVNASLAEISNEIRDIARNQKT